MVKNLLKILFKFKILWYSVNKASSKVGNHSRGQPEGFFFNSYYTEVYEGHYSFPRIAPL